MNIKLIKALTKLLKELNKTPYDPTNKKEEVTSDVLYRLHIAVGKG